MIAGSLSFVDTFVTGSYSLKPISLLIFFKNFVTVDAVYATAQAVHNIIVDICGEPFQFCDKLIPTPTGPELLKYLRNVSFPGKSQSI